MTILDSRAVVNPATKKMLFATLLVVATTFAFTPRTNAQNHHLIHGNDPPGLAAQKMILSRPELANYSQPVEIIVPDDVKISPCDGGGFSTAFAGRITAGMSIGPVYRLMISELPEALDLPAGTSVYPSIELVDRLYPPEGARQQFPVQIVLTQDDIVQAAKGKLVTKVIYLEDPETALPIRQLAGDQATIDVGATEDPVRTADRLGRPMAIVRIGSRIPDPTDLDGEFDFHSPQVEVLAQQPPQQPPQRWPLNQAMPQRAPNTINFSDTNAGQVPNQNLPPIVPANEVGKVPGLRRR